MLIGSGSLARQSRLRSEAPPPALMRFLLLSMLLHATIVMLLGTSHGGGAGRGEDALDVLDVTLRRQAAAPDEVLRSGAGPETAAGRALQRRADQRPAVAPAIEPPEMNVPGADQSTPPTRGQRPEVVPPPKQAVEPLPRIDLRAPQEVEKPLAPPLIVPPVIDRLVVPPNPPELAQPAEVVPPVAPLIPAAPIEHLPAPAAQRELAPPLELAPRATPALPVAPIERLTAPAAPPALAPPVELSPRVAPALPDAPIERLPAPASQQELAPPIELAPRVAPIAPTQLERLAAPHVERQLAPAPDLTAPSGAVPTPGERPGAPTGARPRPVPTGPEAAAPNARVAPSTGAELPRLRLGSPEADEDIFKPRRDVAAPPDQNGSRHIDLDAARKRAREIAGEATSTRGILPALPPPPERKSKESTALEKAVKPDCRTAYAGMGLLAVPALVVSTIGDGGCRW